MIQDPEHIKLLKRIGENCTLLRDAYTERVEYKVPVVYHQETCENFGRGFNPEAPKACDCPQVFETRVRNVRRQSLLNQLKEYQQNKDTDRNPKAERGAPRIKAPGRPPGDMAGFFTLDELLCDIPMVVDRALEEVGRDRTWAAQPVYHVLAGLENMVSLFIGAWPEVARELDKAAARWVATARSTLKITVGDSIFDSVVCGNCGGALATPWGSATEGADVRCAGSPETAPCGETYPMSEWLKLYEDHQRRVRS